MAFLVKRRMDVHNQIRVIEHRNGSGASARQEITALGGLFISDDEVRFCFDPDFAT